MCTETGSAACAPTHTQCEAGTAICDGDVLEHCAFDGVLARFDCAAHGYLGCAGSRCVARD